jgi:predicted RND superfamily exporter protein
MINGISKSLVEHRLYYSLFSVLLIAFLGAGVSKLYFESDYKIFFSDDNPQMLVHEENQDRYTRSDNVTFVIAPENKAIFSKSSLLPIVELTEEAWQIPYSSRVDSLSNYQHTWVEDDDLIVEDLVSDIDILTDEKLEELKRIAINEPVLRKNLVSDQAHVSSISVNLILPDVGAGGNVASQEVVDYSRGLIRKYEEKYPELKIYLIGQTVVNVTFNEMSKQDIETLIPIMFLIIVAFLQIILRSVSGTVCTVVLIAVSVLATQGFMGWTGFAMNQVNVATPVVILSIAVCDAVHILNNYLFNLGQGDSRIKAMEESLKINLQPIFLTSITTAIGFLSMNFSDSPPFQELGTITAFGVMAACLLSMTLFPGVVLMLPNKSKSRRIAKQSGAFSESIGRFAIKHHNKLFYGLLVFAIILISFMFRNDLNDGTIEYFHDDVPFRQAADFTQDNLTGFDQIAYSLDSGEENGINAPEYLKKVEAFAQWYLSQPEVVHVSTFTDVIKRLNKNMHNDDPAWYRIPDDRDLIAQYILLYEMSLPYGLDLNNQIDIGKSSLLFKVRIENQKAKELIEIEERAQAWLAENWPEQNVTGSSVSIMFAHIGQRNIDSMLTGSLMALVLVTLTLIVSLRSLRYGLISLLPNAFPAAMAFGLWGIFVAEVNLAVAVIFAITLGIVVDDTVHFLTKYLRAKRQKGYSSEDALLYSFRLVGKAIITTTIVLASGFMVLAQSSFDVNASMGLMVAITIVIALIWDFLFLPALLLKLDKNKK